MIRIGIVAGEPSGDNLGASLIAAIKKNGQEIQLEGIGGEGLIAEGCHSLYPMERLSVMGLFEIAGRYFELLRMQKHIKRHFLDNPPDVFIGIDAPDFTLPIEKTLREAGIKTVHYVSPSVWAWRQYRLKGIAKSTDLMLTLFPFEERYYQEHNIPVKYVGHPLANEIPLEIDHKQARAELGLNESGDVLALLPGSRRAEVKRLTQPFLMACKRCLEQKPNLTIVVALRDKKTQEIFESIKSDVASELKLRVYVNQTQTVMAAVDVVLLASGTATLETMLMKTPMVVAYKANWLTYHIIIRLLTIPYVSLPNLIAGERLVPEYLQQECEPEQLSLSVMNYFNNHELRKKLIARFKELHQQLIQTETDVAAKAVLQLASS